MSEHPQRRRGRGAGATNWPALPLPDSYRAAFVAGTSRPCSRACESADKDPREVPPRRARCRCPSSRPTRPTWPSWRRRSTSTPCGRRSSSRSRRSGSSTAWRKESYWGERHALDYHVVGSDAAGVVLRAGFGRAQLEGRATRSRSTATTSTTRTRTAHDDSMLAANQRIWGFETNFGGLADIAVVKANQLMPKPTHLTLGGGGGQRAVQLDRVPDAGLAQRRADDPGRQGARLGGRGRHRELRRPVRAERRRHARSAWCPRPRRSTLLHELGVERVIDRRAAGYRFWTDEHTQDESEWRRFGKDIRALVGDDPDIVFEHPGRQTMGASRVRVPSAAGPSSPARRRRAT